MGPRAFGLSYWPAQHCTLLGLWDLQDRILEDAVSQWHKLAALGTSLWGVCGSSSIKGDLLGWKNSNSCQDCFLTTTSVPLGPSHSWLKWEGPTVPILENTVLELSPA